MGSRAAAVAKEIGAGAPVPEILRLIRVLRFRRGLCNDVGGGMGRCDFAADFDDGTRVTISCTDLVEDASAALLPAVSSIGDDVGDIRDRWVHGWSNRSGWCLKMENTSN